MSRSSNNVVLKTPCVRFYEWSGSEGKMRYYDKEAAAAVFVELPFSFLVLDRLHTVSGYCDAERSGFWGNEVRDSVRDPITVRTKAGVVASGIWKQLPAITGLKYAQSIYIAFKNENDQLVIGNIKGSGAFVSAWIEFCKGKNPYDGSIVISSAAEARKGATKYFTPVFGTRPVKPETDAAAKDLDMQLQEYLEAYFKRHTLLRAADAAVGLPHADEPPAEYHEAPAEWPEPPADWQDW